jgi:hypothetical protein
MLREQYHPEPDTQYPALSTVINRKQHPRVITQRGRLSPIATLDRAARDICEARESLRLGSNAISCCV